MNGPLSYKAQQSTVNIKRKNHPLFIFAHEYGGRFFVCCFASVKITKFNIGRTLGDFRNISTISIIWHLLHLYILQYQGCFDPKQSKKRPKNCPKKHPKKNLPNLYFGPNFGLILDLYSYPTIRHVINGRFLEKRRNSEQL